jgi:tetratricopeptide (TPR) repeat protein
MAAALEAAYTLGTRASDAVPLLTQAVDQTTTPDTVAFQPFCTLSLGEAQAQAGHLDQAQALAERALALGHAYQARDHQAYALRLLGEVAAHRDPPDLDQAAAHYHQALALADDLGMRPLVAHCHLGLGTLYAMTGQLEQVRVELIAAIDLYRAMDMSFWLPQASVALARLSAVE